MSIVCVKKTKMSIVQVLKTIKGWLLQDILGGGATTTATIRTSGQCQHGVLALGKCNQILELFLALFSGGLGPYFSEVKSPEILLLVGVGILLRSDTSLIASQADTSLTQTFI